MSAYRLPTYFVDAFTGPGCLGNPAAVVALDQERASASLQEMAARLNQPATAFLRKQNGKWTIRWFTPSVELSLCGHGALAAAWVIFRVMGWPENSAELVLGSGLTLVVRRSGAALEIEMPLDIASPVGQDDPVFALLGGGVDVLANAVNYLAIFNSVRAVEEFSPDFEAIQRLPLQGLIVTAQETGEYDCVSRYFAPKKGVGEDAVTGSAHCAIAPYWSAKLRKPEIVARQASIRGGRLICIVSGDRVFMRGECAPTQQSWISP